MKKKRVYQLAKELGIDHKEVLKIAAALGIRGKKSHSNVLEPEEVQLIVDTFKRGGDAKADEENLEQNVRVVEKSGEKIEIKRKGNVIRRRRKAQDRERPITLKTEGTAAKETAKDLREIKSEELFEEEKESPVILEAENLFKKEKEAKEEEEERGEKEEELKKRKEEDKEGREESLTEEAFAKEKTEGPKVLGKIELQRFKESIKQPVVESSPAFEEEEGQKREGKRFPSKRRKRSKFREFSRADLVDYETARPRKGVKKKQEKKGKEEGEEEELEKKKVETRAEKKVVKMDEVITVGDFARQMGVKASQVITKLFEMGVVVNINDALEYETAAIVADEFGYTVELQTFDEESLLGLKVEDKEEDLVSRPPVVTVMGHVDHGKTSLLDAIRKTFVAAKEHGGITQHIGASVIKTSSGKKITFIDTPGHEAFTQMRARGAKVTDIVVLVVAADDGVMPQTIEAINHAKAAGVPIIVAVNKIDKPEANPEKVKGQLAEQGLQPEDWGGDTMFFEVSAKKGTGLDDLLEGILLLAEIKELKANPNRRAVGTVIEAKKDKARGVLATVLVQNGTLKVQDIFVVGLTYGRVRSLLNSQGERVKEAGPSEPVEIMGINDLPSAGDELVVVESENIAKKVSEYRREKHKLKEQASKRKPLTLEEFSKRAAEEKKKELRLIVKTDVHGTLEALKSSLEELSNEEVRVSVIHGGVGVISQSDVDLAAASQAIVIAFNVRADSRAAKDAEEKGVQVRFYRVIYDVVEDTKKALAGLLEPVKKEVVLGKAEVRDTFNVPKVGTVAGCYVTEGVVKRNALVRLLRDGQVVFEGKLSSLKRFKEDAKEVQAGYECGAGIEGYNDIKKGDVLEIYEIIEEAPSLS
ncbi:MAG: translation initiation factor IF-2 [Candidatus Dadabacteria bacterium]|nr:MAG: translation initiation factor IF-2 [Candidatus Dadabacteria bacterium]